MEEWADFCHLLKFFEILCQNFDEKMRKSPNFLRNTAMSTVFFQKLFQRFRVGPNPSGPPSGKNRDMKEMKNWKNVNKSRHEKTSKK